MPTFEVKVMYEPEGDEQPRLGWEPVEAADAEEAIYVVNGEADQRGIEGTMGQVREVSA